MPWISRADALAAKMNPALELLAIGLAVLVGTIALAMAPTPLSAGVALPVEARPTPPAPEFVIDSGID